MFNVQEHIICVCTFARFHIQSCGVHLTSFVDGGLQFSVGRCEKKFACDQPSQSVFKARFELNVSYLDAFLDRTCSQLLPGTPPAHRYM